MADLKPCPFCGGEAFVNDDPTGNGGKPHMSGNVGLGRLWSVECDECGADAGFWQDRNVAIAAWNSRAERTCRQEERGWGTEGDHARVWLTCGHDCMVPTVQDLPNYCPSCGCKVVDE